MAKFNISIERTIWCGRCVRWHQDSAPKLQAFINRMKHVGWKLDAEGRTLCPACVRELAEGEAWEDIGYRG